jgi:hypothetical protein
MQLVVTGDETYLQDHKPGHRLQQMAWVPVSSPPSIDIRPNYYQKRALYSIFFSPEDVVAKVFSPEERTISGTFYCHIVLPAALSSFRKPHPNVVIHLHHDNEHAHRCQFVQDYIAANDVKIVPIPRILQISP